MPDPAFASLRARLSELVVLQGAHALLDWDQAVSMPLAGGDARGHLGYLRNKYGSIYPEVAHTCGSLAP